MPITKTGKTKDGLTQYRVRVNYTDANGQYRRVEKLVYGKAEAKEAEIQMNESLSPEHSKHRMTVSDLVERYAEAQRHDVRETSLDKSLNTLRIAVLPYLGSIRLDRLGTNQLQHWKNEIGDSDRELSTKRNYYK